MSEKLISTEECARRKGVTRQAITAAVIRGDIPATKVGRTYVVKEEDCEAFTPASPQERGRRGGKRERKQGE